jgi:hypothetical protein
LSRIGHLSAHLAAVEVADDSIAPAENAEARDIGVFGVYVGASVLAGPIGNERQIREAALILVFEQALDGRAGSDGDANPLAKVDSDPVPGIQERTKPCRSSAAIPSSSFCP